MRSTHPAGIRSTYRHSANRRRSAFTLLEVLIATAVTLLMMISLVQVFKVVGDSMKQSRAALQMNNSLRSITSRLRHDLSNLTVRVDPPADTSSGGGYFEYFDGPMTDYTAALFTGAASNRFGDADDILMFTARAGSSWFTGQVPRFVVEPTIPPNAPDSTPVVITSQLAEIAVFARPVLSPASPAGAAFDDLDANGFPDSFRLHYRVLLIRPDLNLVGTTAVRTLSGLSIPSATDLPTTMGSYFQTCDLSMRRVYDGNAAVDDLISANSLEDLANPANRFAHFQYSTAPLGAGTSTTMPLLVLDSNINMPAVSTSGLYPEGNPGALPAALRGAAGSFLSSEYVLGLDRLGEDVLGNNVLAFDIKGFDPGVPVIATQGSDGVWGVGGGGTAGQDGSDDLILTPNDPGYALALTGTNTTVSYGEYVDLLWGRKALNSLASYPFTSSPTPNFSTPLSGIEGTLPTSAPNIHALYSSGLKRSGKALVHLPGFSVVQPTYDTWTTAFESNGTAQTQLGLVNGNPTTDFGTIDVNGLARKYGSASINWTTFDTGSDGLDSNNSGGVDETAERETLPPFPIKLRGIKASVRIEDLNSRQIKQMSVAHEFATQ